MQRERDGSEWSTADYENQMVSLSDNEKIMGQQDERNRQEIFDLKRKLTVKEAMESDFNQEISDLNSTIDLLRSQVSEKNNQLLKVQRSLDSAKRQLEDLNDEKRNIASPEVVPPVERLVKESPKEPEVSVEAFNAVKDKLCSVEETYKKVALRAQVLETTNENLQEEISSWEVKASHLSFSAENAKKSYAEVFAVLEDYKVQLTNAHEELALLSEQPMQPGLRGNSLFSEVDDNRKEVARRFTELKAKYLALTVKFKRSAFCPISFAAEKAGLIQLIAEANDIQEQGALAEVDALRQRIRIQDETIRQLSAEQQAPVKVVKVLGVAAMRYIEDIVTEGKCKERQLAQQLNDLSKSHLLMQEELLRSQANLALANSRIVKALAQNRLQYIDHAMAEAKAASAIESGEDTFEAIPGPMALNGPMPISTASEDPEKPARKSPEQQPQKTQEVPLLVVEAPRVVHDTNYDAARHTPPLCLPAPTIHGSARNPSSGCPSVFPAHGSSKRRASTESALLSVAGSSREESFRRRNLSGPAESSDHVRHLEKDIEKWLEEKKKSARKPKGVHFVEENPEEISVDVQIPVPEPMDESEIKEDSGQKKKYSSFHIPAVKRQKTGNLHKKGAGAD